MHMWVVPILAANTMPEFGHIEGRDKLGVFSESLFSLGRRDPHDASKHIMTNVLPKQLEVYLWYKLNSKSSAEPW